MENRIIKLEGVRNFRDFGGYASSYGGRVKEGRLFRSGNFAKTDAKDAAILDALGVSLQVDLRRPEERERMAAVWPVPGQGVRVIVSDIGREADAPHAEFLQAVEADKDKAFGWMNDYYLHAPYKPQHIEHFKAWFEAIAELKDDEAALVNCAAGKDRTGILCMLTHEVLGVSDVDIMADYLLTNVAAEVEARLPEMARIFNKRLDRDYEPDVYRPFMGVDAKFLRTAQGVIAQKSGSIGGYLADTLNLSDATLAQCRSNLLTR